MVKKNKKNKDPKPAKSEPTSEPEAQEADEPAAPASPAASQPAPTPTPNLRSSAVTPGNPMPSDLVRHLGITLLSCFVVSLLITFLAWPRVTTVHPEHSTQDTSAESIEASAGTTEGAATAETEDSDTSESEAANDGTVEDAPAEPAKSREEIEPEEIWTNAFGMTGEPVLLLMVIAVAALGSLIHASTSFASFVGNGKAKASWLWWYLLRLPIGMSLAIVSYVVFRGGFFAGDQGPEATNPFGFAALAGLAGMFSKQATDKLEEIADALFRVDKGDNARGDKLDGNGNGNGNAAAAGAAPAAEGQPAGSPAAADVAAQPSGVEKSDAAGKNA